MSSCAAKNTIKGNSLFFFAQVSSVASLKCATQWAKRSLMTSTQWFTLHFTHVSFHVVADLNTVVGKKAGKSLLLWCFRCSKSTGADFLHQKLQKLWFREAVWLRLCASSVLINAWLHSVLAACWRMALMRLCRKKFNGFLEQYRIKKKKDNFTSLKPDCFCSQTQKTLITHANYFWSEGGILIGQVMHVDCSRVAVSRGRNSGSCWTEPVLV